MTNFEFVISDGAPKRPSAAVRSHAVKSGLQRKKCQPAEIESGSRDSQLTIRQKGTLKGRFRITETPAKTKKTAKTTIPEKPAQVKETKEPPVEETIKLQSTTNDVDGTALEFLGPEDSTVNQSVLAAQWELINSPTVSSPSQGWGDPFNAFTVPQNSDVDKLMKFFIARFELQVAISHVQKQWWGFAVSDPLVMHTTLGLAAATWSMFIANPNSVVNEGAKQKWLAIRGIQERLGQSENSMALVGAIANLANIEGVEGDFNVARVHLNGLDLLMKARGGYSAFRSNVDVARAITWSDLQAAAGLDQRPLFPLIIPLDSVCLPARVLSAADSPSLSHLKTFEGSSGASIVRFNFSLLRQADYALKSKSISADDLRVLINAVDFQLANSLAESILTERGRVILTAARAFLFIVIRETRPLCTVPKLIVRRLAQQLRNSIHRLSTRQDCWHGLLWCLTLGTASSYETGENWDFFSSSLSKTLQIMNVQDSMELEAITRRFLWDQKFPGSFIDTYGPNLFCTTIDLQD
ncbi:Fc.00g066940.m01.CDS01 [Cosmosporella sp. VM-42]